MCNLLPVTCTIVVCLFILQVLHAHTGLVTSSQLSEEMERLHVTIMRANPKFQSCGATDSSISDRYAEDIEAESNSYFLQMYSCQLTVDAVVLKLSQFKESSEKRCDVFYGCCVWYHVLYNSLLFLKSFQFLEFTLFLLSPFFHYATGI